MSLLLSKRTALWTVKCLAEGSGSQLGLLSCAASLITILFFMVVLKGPSIVLLGGGVDQNQVLFVHL